jgi:hypothetical protein
MGYLGYKPADKPLTAADITDSIITSAKIVDGTIVNADINASAAIVASKLSGTGKVLQVVQVIKSDTFTVSVADGSYADITGLSVSITPSSSSNKILVFAKVDGGGDSSATRPQYYRLLRNSTVIGNGVDSGSRLGNSFSAFSVASITRTMGSSSINFLDSPATTSSTTYKIQVAHEAATTATVYINRSQLDDDSTQTKRGSSIITLLEIAA